MKTIKKAGSLPPVKSFECTCTRCNTQFIYDDEELWIYEVEKGVEQSMVTCPFERCYNQIAHNPNTEIK